VATAFSSKPTNAIVGVLDEKGGVFDVVFLGQLGEKFPSNRSHIRRKQA